MTDYETAAHGMRETRPFHQQVQQALQKGRLPTALREELHRRLERVRRLGGEYKAIGLSPEADALMRAPAAPEAVV